MNVIIGGKGSDIDLYVSTRDELTEPEFDGGHYDQMSDQIGEDMINMAICVPEGTYQYYILHNIR